MGKFAVLRQSLRGFASLFSGGHAFLQRTGHAIESMPHHLRFLTAHMGEANVVLAATDFLQSMNYLLNGLQSTTQQPVDQQYHHRHTSEQSDQNRHKIVPAIEHCA